MLGNALGEELQSAGVLRIPFLARRVRSEYERAVQLDPASIDARHGLVQFFARAPAIAGGGMDKAKEEARAIGALNAAQGHAELAELLMREQDLAGAERELVAAIAAAPDSASFAYRLGLLYQDERKWTQAFAVYERLMKDRPGDPLAHYYWGRTAAFSGQHPDRGEQELRYWLVHSAASSPAPLESAVHQRLGMIYERGGRLPDARNEYQAALAINPKNDEARRSLAAMKPNAP